MSEYYDAEMAAGQARLARTGDMVRQRARLMRALAPKPGEHILELGAGNGIFTGELIDAVGPAGKVVGLDSSDAILDTARHICPQGEFLLADAQDLPLEDASCDGVVAAQLFCFLGDVDRALAEAFRVLRPGGRLVILDTDWDSLVWRNRIPALMARMIDAYTAIYADAHLPRTLPQRLAEAGFSDISADSFVILNTRFEEDSYARQSAEFAISMMDASPAFSSEERAAWLEDQEALDRVGGFFFSLNRYVISAGR